MNALVQAADLTNGTGEACPRFNKFNYEKKIFNYSKGSLGLVLARSDRQTAKGGR